MNSFFHSFNVIVQSPIFSSSTKIHSTVGRMILKFFSLTPYFVESRLEYFFFFPGEIRKKWPKLHSLQWSYIAWR